MAVCFARKYYSEESSPGVDTSGRGIHKQPEYVGIHNPRILKNSVMWGYFVSSECTT
ncbi:hypothetical protein BDV93DRAFT_518502 [Ceratobasidium sp. AG-I]|nr:hypothetical protein BDV93DRAFT_518502 [Ceratobasidium sp. AG-I]